MKKLSILILLALSVACSTQHANVADYNVIPLPQSVKEGKAAFSLREGVQVVYSEGDESMKRNAAFLCEYVNDATGLSLSSSTDAPAKGNISLVIDTTITNPEAYVLSVERGGVTITGSTAAGVFYGIQTLRKSLPTLTEGAVGLPEVSITDEPRFAYRGMMLDVGRHFFSVDSVKRYIDMLALHNMNRMHWHLSEDQGWRIEIKRYPELTEIGSMRKETVIGRNTGVYDGTPYGGYYTQDEARAIVEYAKERYITVIPEIDLPGHMLGALAAYPELGCTGGPYETWTHWGVSYDVLCAGNDAALEFVKNVLSEIVEIFPSEYIHIGGDECPKVRWKYCPKCQAKIRELGIVGDEQHSAEEHLQSYFISSVSEHLASKGRNIIGWDEILEGGLADGATVMAWRGANYGRITASMGNDVIMSPTSHCYLDYYQADPSGEPLAIGGYLPLEKVYSFEPVVKGIEGDAVKHIKGVQGNLWTEYVPTFAHAEYMVLPRMAALAEVAWTKPALKNYSSFVQRVYKLFGTYDLYNYNYAKHLYDITAEVRPNYTRGVLDMTLSTVDNTPIYYTLDGTEPTAQSALYSDTLRLDASCVVRAVALREGSVTTTFVDTIKLHKASMKPITMLEPINPSYSFNGAPTLVDGLYGWYNYKNGRWLGFCGNSMVAVIDLLKPTSISSLELSTLVERGDWILDITGLSIETSDDGVTFTPLTEEFYTPSTEQSPNGVIPHSLSFDPTTARYVKVTAHNIGKLPEWHGAAGNHAYIFVDEIVLK